MDILTLIEQGALDRLKTKLAGVKAAGIQRDAAGLFVNPALAAAVLDGDFERITDTTYKAGVTVSVLLKFKQLQGEEQRRKGINPLVIGSTLALFGQTFGLQIKPLRPLRFRNVTTVADQEAGEIKYLVQLGTSFTLKAEGEEAIDDLLRVGLDYFLKPGDATLDASDLVEIGKS